MKRISIIMIAALFLITACTVNKESPQNEEDLYNDVLDAFKNFVNAATIDPNNTANHYFEFFKVFADDREDSWKDLRTGLSRAVLFGAASIDSNYNQQNLGYAIKDINGDYVPELVLLTKEFFVLGAFSFANNKPQLLGGYWDRHTCEIDASGLFYVHNRSGASNGEWVVQQVSTDRCQLTDLEKYVSYDHSGDYGYYKVIDGRTYTINESEMNTFWEAFSSVSTKNIGLEFVPLFEEQDKQLALKFY